MSNNDYVDNCRHTSVTLLVDRAYVLAVQAFITVKTGKVYDYDQIENALRDAIVDLIKPVKYTDGFMDLVTQNISDLQKDEISTESN